MRRYALGGVGVLLAVLGAAVVFQSVSSTRSSSDGFVQAARSLKDGYEITVTEASPATSSAVGREEAMKTARRETRFLGGELDSAHLVYLTDPHFGRQQKGHPTVPFYDHDLVWLVLFRHAEDVMFGGAMGGVAPQAASATGAAVAAFVDARTGAMINATTIADLR